jgi:hypothetical protein
MAGRLDDWNAGVRSWLAGKLNDAIALNANGQAGNVAGKLQKSIWGNPEQRDILVAAMGNDPHRVASMDTLMEIYRRIGQTLPEGSPTATDVVAQRANGVSNGVKILGKVLSPSSWANFGNELVDGVNALRTPAARIRLADHLLSPQGVQQLQQLRMLPANGERALGIAGQVLVDAGVIGSGVRNPTDFPAPDAPRKQGRR